MHACMNVECVFIIEKKRRVYIEFMSNKDKKKLKVFSQNKKKPIQNNE